MKKAKVTITIGHNRYGYYFSDADTDLSDAPLIDVFGLLIARLSGSIQYDAVMKNYAEYRIDIVRNNDVNAKANITFGRNRHGYYYSDECEDWNEVNMLCIMKVLIQRLARIIDHDEIVRTTGEYQIDISKSMIE